MKSDDNKIFDYLRVDEFMRGMMESRGLETAFELGIIDSLIEKQVMSMEEIKINSGCTGSGGKLLINLLKMNRVIEEKEDGIRLTEKFQSALFYRDIMLARLQFANLVAPDFTDLFTYLVREPEAFYRNSRVIDLFGYNRAVDYSPDNYERTKRWVEITSTLTKYEAPVCIENHDFSGYQRILDIGGNSGEFALRICNKYTDISATVFDLPLVCDIGRKHVEQEPESARITFEKGNAFNDPLPEGFDLVTFKSMLHDWPDDAACRLITRGSESLVPGGKMLIFERGPIELEDTVPSYSILPFLLFSHSFRDSALYEKHLSKLGFKKINVMKIDLETPFFLITGTK